MKKFDGILICTDLDGTLLKNDGTISRENIDAIEYFKENGGRFTFVTGRMPYYAAEMYKAVNPNAPIGCINGGGVYDYAAKQYLWTQPMPQNVVELIKCVDDALANVGIQICCFNNSRFLKDNETMVSFREVTGLPYVVCDYNSIPDDIAKILFGSEINDEILAVEKMLKSHPLAENFDFVRSEKTLYEILPKGIGKGVVLSKIAELLGIDIEKTIAIGDYDNDISMFKTAKLGIAVENACEAAKKAADFITVSNEDHAIAQLISDLENGKYKI